MQSIVAGVSPAGSIRPFQSMTFPSHGKQDSADAAGSGGVRNI